MHPDRPGPEGGERPHVCGLGNAPHVWIRYEKDTYVCGDEDGEFARADHIETILHYVTDLIVGPGTMRAGGLKDA